MAKKKQLTPEQIRPHLPDCRECGENEWNIQGKKAFKITCEWCEYKLTQHERNKIYKAIEDHEEFQDPNPKSPQETKEKEQERGLENSQGPDQSTEEDTDKENPHDLADEVEKKIKGNFFNTQATGEIPEEEDEEKFQNLSEKQKMFCQEYIKDFNGTRAAKEAGYSEDTARQTASENLTKPDIILYLQHLKEQRMNRLQLEQDDVIRDLQIVKNRSMQAYPVRDREGVPTGLWTYDANAAIKATELLGKHLGMFITNKVEHSGENGKPISITSDIEVEALSTQQLESLKDILETSEKYRKEQEEKEEDENTPLQ